MGWFSNFTSSSIGRKFLMGITGLFLVTFIAVHLLINSFSLVSADLFNAGSHFMGTNPLIQAMQYVLAAGFLFHIVMGIVLTIRNNAARPVKYAMNKPGENSNFASRSMIYTGLLVMLFLFLHMRDFFVPIKFQHGSYGTDYDLLVQVFSNPAYVALYVVAFILLGIHLYHGFQSAFQTIGVNHPKYTPAIKFIGVLYCVVVTLGFSAIALFHFFNSLS
jgi:succinate dehydrogenase / fumarate reductase cytochrome b subunit